jgi:hypothetical protein
MSRRCFYHQIKALHETIIDMKFIPKSTLCFIEFHLALVEEKVNR